MKRLLIRCFTWATTHPWWALFIILALANAGCAPSIAEECRGYGFTPGTENFSTCSFAVGQARQNRAAAVNAAMMQGYGAALVAPRPASGHGYCAGPGC